MSMEDYLNIDPASPTLEKYWRIEQNEVSNCCGASIKWHDICTACGEHCDIVSDINEEDLKDNTGETEYEANKSENYIKNQ